MLHTQYQGSMPCGFRQEDFFSSFPNEKHYICDLWGGSIFSPQWHNFNKLGRGPLDDAAYQISRL